MANLSDLKPTDFVANSPSMPNISQLQPDDYAPADASPTYQPVMHDGSIDVGNAVDNAGKFLTAHNAPGSQIGQTLGTWGGYLLTKLGDSIHGTNHAQNYSTQTPTFLQNAGDLANSALIAGSTFLGPEAPEAVLGAEGAGTEAATQAPGMLSKLLPTGQIGQGVALGAGSGAAQSLADGKTDPSQIVQDALTGGVFGGALGLGGKVLGGIGKDLRESSVPTQIANVLKEFATTPQQGLAELGRYTDAAIAHTSDIRAATPTGIASEDVARAGDLIQKKISSAGKAIGAALKSDGHGPVSLDITSVDPATGQPEQKNVVQNFLTNVENMFGHGITDDFPATANVGQASGGNPADALGGDLNDYMARHANDLTDGKGSGKLTALTGRAREVAPGDQKRILDVYNQLKTLQSSPTVQTASDIMHNLDDKIDWTKVDQFGVNHDPLQALLMQTRGTLNAAVRASSPAVAAANDAFSQLKDIDGQIGQFAGKDLQRGALLLRRVFSGDQSKNSLALLDQIKHATGIDLTKSAVLAKFATDTFGDASQQTLLRQQMGGAVNDSSTLAGSAKQLVRSLTRGAERVLTPDPMEYAKHLVSGNPRVPYGVVGVPGAALDKIVGSISPELQKMGMNANNAEQAAKKLLKAFLIDRMSQPNSAVQQ